ncbi:uncharacterized protein BXZ73DRAFT_78698 [Epithele typhae]|uniref:uncharacterized protein n=1 Tax=Epithele typhae TaxID=378194 RepID=UPI002007A707|nr:uncharacterized protein BXZ73DRAFT_78698 [Epithele typhae]KAH9926602.1 hypothetical protein BXZ73DRAFT_78698 [Epithele typhae]
MEFCRGTRLAHWWRLEWQSKSNLVVESLRACFRRTPDSAPNERVAASRALNRHQSRADTEVHSGMDPSPSQPSPSQPSPSQPSPSQPILDMLHTLPSIKALALGFKADITTETIELLSSSVPMDINAFRIGGYAHDYLIKDVFLSFVCFRPVMCNRTSWLTHRARNYRPQLLEGPPPALQLHGFGPYLRWLVPGPGGPAASDPPRQWTEHWSPRKVTFRTVEDSRTGSGSFGTTGDSMPPGARVQP